MKEGGTELLRATIPYLVITALFALPGVPFLSIETLTTVAGLALIAGLGSRWALEWGRRKGTEYVLAGLGAGTVLKAISLGLSWLMAWRAEANVAGALLVNLGLLLLYSGWTSYHLTVSSGAGFTTHEPD